MAAYFIAQYKVNDRDLYQEYAQGAGPTVAASGGKLVSMDIGAETVEGDPPGPQTVIIEFESLSKYLYVYPSAIMLLGVCFSLSF